MREFRGTSLFLAIALSVAPASARATSPIPADYLVGQTAGQDMKTAGTDTKDAAKSAGSGVKKGTKTGYRKTKNGTKTAYRKTKNGTKKAYHKTGKGMEKAGDKMEGKPAPQ